METRQPIRVAFVGKSKVGVTFCARYLVTHHGFKKLSLQDGVRRMLKRLYYYGTYKRLTWEFRYRVYDALYKIDPNVWINYLEVRLKNTPTDVVVEDVRYMNELDRLKLAGFTIVRITAPEKRRINYIRGILDSDAGTVILNEWFNKDFAYQVDYSIYNETKEGTRKALDDLVERLKKVA